MKKIIGVLLILGLLLVPTGAGADSGIEIVDRTGDGVWIETWWIEMYPGETKVTSFEFKNRSGYTLEVNLLIVHAGDLYASWCYKNFVVESDELFRDCIRITADGSIPPGVYELTWTVGSKIVDVVPITEPGDLPDEEPVVEEPPVGEDPVDEEPIETPGEEEPVKEPDEEDPVDEPVIGRQWSKILVVSLLACVVGFWFIYLAREGGRKKKEKEKTK